MIIKTYFLVLCFIVGLSLSVLSQAVTYSKTYDINLGWEIGMRLVQSRFNNHVLIAGEYIDTAHLSHNFHMLIDSIGELKSLHKISHNKKAHWKIGDFTRGEGIFGFRTLQYFDDTNRLWTWPVLLKASELGDTLWTREYNHASSKVTVARTVLELRNRNLLLVMERDEWPDANPLIYLTDSEGVVLDSLEIKRTGHEGFLSAIEHPSGSIYLSGASNRRFMFPQTYKYELWLVELNSELDIRREFFYPSSGSVLSFMSLCSDGSLLLTGDTLVWDRYPDYTLNEKRRQFFRVDTNGQVLQRKVSGKQNQDGYFTRIYELEDSSIIALGREHIGSSIYFVLNKFTPEGDTLWMVRYAYDKNFRRINYLWDMEPTPDGGFIMVGDVTHGPSGTQDVWVVKTDSNGYCEGASEVVYDLRKTIDPIDTTYLDEERLKNKKYLIYPSPTRNVVHIEGGKVQEIRLFTNSGADVKVPVSQNENGHIIDLSDVPTGMYHLRFKDEEGYHFSKIVKE